MGSLNRAWIGLAIKFALAASAFAAETSQTQDNVPTTVYVSSAHGLLFSGPGEDFYPTGKIAQNSPLEVYLQAPGNWLGVRPPAGSFSWVQAADAYLLPGGRMIEVTNPAAVSWIGTSLGSAKQYRWQVKLNPGEQLGVIGEQTTPGEGDKEILWYKIAPPAGEFRWIQAASVNAQPVSSTSQNRVAKASAGAAPRGSNSKAPQSKKTRRADAAVVSAAYQPETDAEVISLGNPEEHHSGRRRSGAPFIVSGSYPKAPRPGEIINGEVVVSGEYAPGDVIREQAMNGGLADGSSTESSYYDGEYYGGEYDDGENYDAGYADGEYAGGEYYADEYGPGEIIGAGPHFGSVQGEVIYDGEDYIDGVVRSTSKGTFAGWHALELTDDGMRFTWLERLYGRAKQNGPDPLQADPFSLAMNKGQVRPNSPLAVQQMYPQGMPQTTHMEHTQTSVPRRRHRPWRDPRMLGDARSSQGLGPSVAPALSSREPGGSDLDQLSPESTSIGAGLQRLADAFNSGGTHTPTQLNTNSSAAGDVNWYGLGAGQTPATLASHQNVASGEPLQAVTTNLDLSQLQLSLSEAVAQPMQLWTLQPIYDSARYYVEHGASAIERGQARLLMERVEEFAELAARSGYLALNRSSLGSTTLNSNTATNPIVLAGATNSALGSVVSSDFQRAVAGGSGYDATGWLVPVIAASAGQPSHALTDDLGRIQAYVSPAPGLNLNRYINQAVGITGLRGYLPQLQAGHVQASRVVRLQ